jgi:hypothetical protein
MFLACPVAIIHVHENCLKQVGVDAAHALAIQTQCCPKVLGLMFLKIEDIPFLLFKISLIGIFTGFCAVVQFLKSCWKFIFLDLL